MPANTGVICSSNYSSEIKLPGEVRADLKWWVQNIHLNNGRSVLPYPLQLIIASTASLEGWGAFCQGHKTGGHWTLSEKKDRIAVLELTAAKYTILTFTRLYPTAKTVNLKNGQNCCPFRIGENGRYSKSITYTD